MSDDIIIDPKSYKYNGCPSGCGCKDVRVHFMKTPDGEDTKEYDRLHWCLNCGIGYNSKRGFVDALIFGSCVSQKKIFDENKK